jgi:class 3 adenylate cyclase
MEQQIRFCATSDSVRIAYATMGKGPPLVYVPGWLSPFKFMAHEPRVASMWQEVAANRGLVLFDRRGTGMSGRDVRDFSRVALVRDLEAVVDHLKLRRVALIAWDVAGVVAIEYAHRHPEKASHLILYGSFARGQDVGTRKTNEALIRLIRGGWDIASEMLPALRVPGADPETARRWITSVRESCSGDSAAAQLEAAVAEDVSELLPEIEIPTLILHARHDRAFPFELGRELASLLPNARLVALDYDVHWDPRDLTPVVEAINDFLAPRKPAKRKPPKAAAPSGLVTIMFTDMEGSTTLTQRLGDARAQEVLRTHNTTVRDALKACGGSQIKHTGDGIMAAFPAASKALECAIAIQKAFDERNRSLSARPEPLAGQPVEPRAASEEPIRVRIGLNAGEPVAEDEDLFGAAVQFAARVCAHAQPGQILAANVVRELAAGKGVMFSDRGDVTLRGFEDPVRLYEVRWQADSDAGQA